MADSHPTSIRERPKRLWLIWALLVGIAYAAIGILLGLPKTHAREWRLTAWLLSVILYAAHIGYEQIKLRNSSRSTAIHVASAVAIGAFGLAVSAFIHSLVAPPNYSRWRFVLALILWPLITALPAFAVAFVISLLSRHFLTKQDQA
jgi:hypothetical protein